MGTTPEQLLEDKKRKAEQDAYAKYCWEKLKDTWTWKKVHGKEDAVENSEAHTVIEGKNAKNAKNPKLTDGIYEVAVKGQDKFSVIVSNDKNTNMMTIRAANPPIFAKNREKYKNVFGEIIKGYSLMGYRSVTIDFPYDSKLIDLEEVKQLIELANENKMKVEFSPNIDARLKAAIALEKDKDKPKSNSEMEKNKKEALEIYAKQSEMNKELQDPELDRLQRKARADEVHKDNVEKVTNSTNQLETSKNELNTVLNKHPADAAKIQESIKKLHAASVEVDKTVRVMNDEMNKPEVDKDTRNNYLAKLAGVKDKVDKVGIVTVLINLNADLAVVDSAELKKSVNDLDTAYKSLQQYVDASVDPAKRAEARLQVLSDQIDKLNLVNKDVKQVLANSALNDADKNKKLDDLQKALLDVDVAQEEVSKDVASDIDPKVKNIYLVKLSNGLESNLEKVLDETRSISVNLVENPNLKDSVREYNDKLGLAAQAVSLSDKMHALTDSLQQQSSQMLNRK